MGANNFDKGLNWIIVNQFHFHKQSMLEAGNRDDRSIPEQVIRFVSQFLLSNLFAGSEEISIQHKFAKEQSDAFGCVTRQIRIGSDKPRRGFLPLNIAKATSTNGFVHKIELR